MNGSRMNEQELADLFSEQIDRFWQGEAPATSPEAGELSELLNFIEPTTTQFQASTAAQAAFAGQLAGWFSLANGGTAMTILGLSKVWFISIVAVAVTIITGAGLIAIVASSIFIFGPVTQLPPSPTGSPIATAATTGTTTPASSPTATALPDASATPTLELNTTPNATPQSPPVNLPPTLIFINTIQLINLCQGAYTTQRTLLNYGPAPIDDAALAWEVLEGDDWVDKVSLDSPDLDSDLDETDASDDEANPDATLDTTETPTSSYYVNFSPIAFEQKVKLDIKVKVKDDWWGQPNGTQIKVKLSVKNKSELPTYQLGDSNRGHGNDPDHFDEDNPGHGSHPASSQILTIVKQGAEWVTLTGPVQPYGPQSFLVDGVVVATTPCTGLPPTLPPGANVSVVGILLPNGTFSAINISIIDITIINVNFGSGVPQGGDSDSDSDSGGSGNNDGGSQKNKGGSQKNKGGSKK